MRLSMKHTCPCRPAPFAADADPLTQTGFELMKSEKHVPSGLYENMGVGST